MNPTAQTPMTALDRRRPAMTARLAAWTAALVAVLLLTSTGQAAASGLTLGFLDQGNFVTGAPASNAAWLDRAQQVGAGMIRVNVRWLDVAPTRPPSPAQAADPSWPGYDWTTIDTAVRAANARGLRVLLTVMNAPPWAEAAGAPSGIGPGAWMPDPAAFGSFATAIAQRYSGATPDPAAPGVLPRVDAFQAWNEPNIAYYLSPQWQVIGGQLVNVAAGWYRSLLNAFYAGVKQAQPAATVVAAGMSPYGDYPIGGPRTPPARFWRDLLCLQLSLAPTPCPDPAHFDVVDSHPYDIKGPLHAAVLPDDLTMPDIGKLRRIVTAAEQNHTVVPAAPKQYWATEFSWDSSPPDPNGVPAQRQAHWLEESVYELWSQGVSVISWFLIDDEPPIPDYTTTYQSGLFMLNGAPKPAATAYRFPFVVQCPLAGNGNIVTSCLVWGKAPGPHVIIERSVRGHWRPVLAPRPSADGVFQARLRLSQGSDLRAISGTGIRAGQSVDRSLDWRITQLRDGT